MDDICLSCLYRAFGAKSDIGTLWWDKDKAAPIREERALKVNGDPKGALKSDLKGTSGSKRNPETAILAKDSKLQLQALATSRRTRIHLREHDKEHE